MPEISVVVLNWNGKQFLETCLTALRCQTFQNFETILVDNASTDGSAEYVRTSFPEVRLVLLRENLGFTGGNIAGKEQSQGEIVVLLNNDTEADANWLGEIHKAAADFPAAGSFASKMLFFDDRRRIDNCGFALSQAGFTTDLGRDQQDGPAWSSTCKVFGACGGAAAYRRSMLDEVGFLDPDFFITYEDLDLSFRAQLRGYECMFLPNAIVYHRYRATMVKHPARQTYFSQRNIEIVYLKNMPLGLIIRGLPQRLLYEVGAAIYFLKLGVGSAFMRAKLDALLRIPSVLRKRTEIQKKRALSNAQVHALMQRKRWNVSKWNKFLQAWRRTSQALL